MKPITITRLILLVFTLLGFSDFMAWLHSNELVRAGFGRLGAWYWLIALGCLIGTYHKKQ